MLKNKVFLLRLANGKFIGHIKLICSNVTLLRSNCYCHKFNY